LAFVGGGPGPAFVAGFATLVAFLGFFAAPAVSDLAEFVDLGGLPRAAARRALARCGLVRGSAANTPPSTTGSSGRSFELSAPFILPQSSRTRPRRAISSSKGAPKR
jgi:hypothetical protein